MKKLMCLLLALLIVISIFSGCENSGNDREEDDRDEGSGLKGDKDDPNREDDPDQGSDEGRQLLYDYVKNTLVPEKGLANLGEVTWIHDERPGGVEQNWQVLKENGCFGLLAAVVRDFDLDGQLELVTFTLGTMVKSETWPQLYSRYTSSYPWVISMDLYNIEGDQVVLSDSVPCMNQIDDDTTSGGLSIYLELLEDGIYIDSHSSSINYTTEGASPRTVYHVSGEKFVFDYISGIGWGQGSLDENPNNVIGTANMKVDDYTICAHLNAEDKVRNVLRMNFSQSREDSDMMIYSCTDDTQLRKVLEQGVETVAYEPLPQGGLKPEDPAVAATRHLAEALAAHVSEQSGCVYVNTIVRAYNQEATFRYETEGYSFLSMTFHAETGKLLRLSVSNNKYPVPGEWYNMKDAVIDYPDLGLDRSELELFYGSSVSLNKYTNGVDITGANVAIRQISSTDFVIETDD